MVHLLKVEMMNKIYKQDVSKKAFYIFSSQNGGSSFNSKKKKKTKKNERIVELKKTKCNYCHEKGHWAKECEKKKEDKKEESFANFIETSSFANFVEAFGFIKVLVMQLLQAMDLHIKATYMTG